MIASWQDFIFAGHSVPNRVAFPDAVKVRKALTKQKI
jgi:hypothetical protein